ncbi:MAG: hypothetical protein ABIG20_05215 [archaeon]
MKKSISHLVETKISAMPMLESFLARGLVNQSALARDLLPELEDELCIEVNPQAVIMAVKRYTKAAQDSKFEEKINDVLRECTVNLKSGVADISVEKTNDIFTILNEISKKVDTKKGELLSVIQGVSEISIIIEEKHADTLLKKLQGKKILVEERDAVELHIMAPPSWWDIPGIISHVTRQISIHGINIIDIVSTTTELSILVRKKDATHAFEALNKLIEQSKS